MMWHTMTRAAVGLALGALSIGATGCATKAPGSNISYAEPDTEAIGPQAPRANTIYGMTRLMRAQGNTEQAELALIGLMKEFPEYSPAYNDLAEIRIQQGRFEEAIHYINRGLEIAPNDAVLLNNAGVCALIKHDYAKALGHFQRALDLAPYESRYRANVALATGLNGDIAGSRALYQTIVSKEATEHNIALIESIIAPTAVASPADATTPAAPFDFALLAPQELAGPALAPALPEQPVAAPQPETEAEILLTPSPATAPADESNTNADANASENLEPEPEQEPITPKD